MDFSEDFPPDEEYDMQCGEIFLTIRGDLLIHCAFCETRYKDFRKYADHIVNGHFHKYLRFEKSECLNEEAYGNEHINNNCNLKEINEKDEIQQDSTYEERPLLEKSSDCENLEIDSDALDSSMENIRENKTFFSDYISGNTKLENNDRFNINTITRITPRIESLKSTKKNRSQVCPQCGIFFNDRSNLNAHIKRHSLIKSHHCVICPKSFFTCTELKTHVRSHTGEKPFMCTSCGQGFTTSSKLTLHSKRHANIKDKECKFCDMKFSTCTALKNHEKIHSEDRPFECEICNESFKTQKGLDSHMKAHRNKREYKCNICPVAFNQKCNLTMHRKAKHGIVASDKNFYSNTPERKKKK